MLTVHKNQMPVTKQYQRNLTAKHNIAELVAKQSMILFHMALDWGQEDWLYGSHPWEASWNLETW